MPPSRRNLAPPAAQLALFAPPPDPMDAVYTQWRPVADALPAGVRLGTMAWSFPGWTGLVWSRARGESDLAREGLAEYARHPLLRTVEFSRGYYAPIPPKDLARYAAQLPLDFVCCAKVPEGLVAPVHLGHGRGERGAPNPEFLSVARFVDATAGPWVECMGERGGPLVLEFPPVPAEHRLAPAAFVAALDRFLGALPRGLELAVEVRDRAVLALPAYAAVLAAHGVAHVYNYWTAMPLPGAQVARAPLDAAPFIVLRLLLRPGTRYDDRKQAMAPFDRIVDEDPAMRADVVALTRAAIAAGRRVFVLVNNKAEGSAPRTIAALATLLAT